MHLANHIPLPRPGGCIKLHGDVVEAGSTGVQRPGANNGDDTGDLREGVRGVACLGEIEVELGRLILHTVVANFDGKIVNALGPHHAAGAATWLRDVHHRDAAVLIAADVDDHLVFVVACIHVGGGGDTRLEDLIGPQGGRPREDRHGTGSTGGDNAQVGTVDNDITG